MTFILFSATPSLGDRVGQSDPNMVIGLKVFGIEKRGESCRQRVVCRVTELSRSAVLMEKAINTVKVHYLLASFSLKKTLDNTFLCLVVLEVALDQGSPTCGPLLTQIF